jgi:trk system potassium uptake protein TrkH
VGTVGNSTGITPYLSSVGKLVLVLCMYMGRLSPVTIMVALHLKTHPGEAGIARPEAKVIIG